MDIGNSRPLNEADSEFYARVLKDFGAELACLNEGMDLLGLYIQYLVNSEEILVKPALTTNLIAASEDTRSKSSWIILSAEFQERVSVAVLLLKLGHQSRSLACARDAFECLRWSDVCLREPAQAKRWVQGKKVQIPKGYAFPPQLSNELEGKIQSVLSVSGTHAYIDACLLSVYPAAPFVAGQSKDSGAIDAYKFFTIRSFIALLYILGTGIEYLTNSEASLRGVSDPTDTL